jgi:hypothetical protein
MLLYRLPHAPVWLISPHAPAWLFHHSPHAPAWLIYDA